MALKKLPFPVRDREKYPRPEDEPPEAQCQRLGLRPPEPGEDPISWAQNQPGLLRRRRLCLGMTYEEASRNLA